MQENLNKKIEDAMRSLDGIQQATPEPFFFTRLEARMQRERGVWDKISSFVAKPIIAFACICLVIMINAVVIFSSTYSQKAGNSQSNELATVDEYTQVSSTLYEFVNTNP
ncbi:MAG: hypothetical protein ABI325_11245 [Ginsengibacter sp.]